MAPLTGFEPAALTFDQTDLGDRCSCPAELQGQNLQTDFITFCANLTTFFIDKNIHIFKLSLIQIHSSYIIKEKKRVRNMNLKRMQHMKLKALLLAFLLTLMLVGGIPMIIFGATQKLTFLLIAGIVFTVLGFYGCPLAWVRFGSRVGLQNTLIAIEQEKITNLKKLSLHLSKDEKTLRADIRLLIQLNCLQGYTLDEEGNIISNQQQPKEETVRVGKCPHCNAPLSFDEEMIRCPYCGIILTHTKKENTK